MTVGGSGTLGGNGTVGIVICDGNIAPGSNPGILTTSNVVFSPSGDFFVELTSTTLGAGYDQLNVRGTNYLTNAVLHVAPAFTTPAAVSNQFVILNNDGVEAITGVFSGLGEGATVTSGGYTFRINYHAGTFNNDVMLTLLDMPGAGAAFVSSGNGDAIIDPNECDNLSIVIKNKTGSTMTGVSATLSSITEGIAVTQPFAPYPNIAGNGTGTNPGAQYRLTVSGGSCRPVLNIAAAPANKAHLDWTTAAGGYLLESTNVLVNGGLPLWGAVSNTPIVFGGRYHVTNNVTSSNVFYHLSKPVP